MDESEIAVTSKNLLYSRFENGLFKKIEYYALPVTSSEDECEDFIVGVFGSGIKNMLSSSFSKLVSGGWITNYLIDAAFHVHMNDELRTKFINVRCSESSSIVEGTISPENVLCHVFISQKILLLPVRVNENHWCLIIAVV